jgi:hypothetical protein
VPAAELLETDALVETCRRLLFDDATRAELAALRAELDEVRAHVANIEATRTWKVRSRLNAFLRR